MEGIGIEWSGDGIVTGLGGTVTLTSPVYEDGLHISGATNIAS